MNNLPTKNITIRSGTPGDLPRTLELIRELAEFEKEPEAVTTTVESMLEDGFGKRPVFGFFVAEVDQDIVGISVYYYRYSTWRGTCIYLEDLIVTESHRGSGIGKLLFDRTVQKAKDDNCNGVSWQVLDWNKPAIDFYEKYSAKIEGQWMNCSLSKRQVEQFES